MNDEHVNKSSELAENPSHTAVEEGAGGSANDRTIATRGLAGSSSSSERKDGSKSDDGSRSDDNATSHGGDAGAQSAAKKVSDAKVKMQMGLPVLADDADLRIEKEQVVTRDGKSDLAFMGTLLASVAPSSAPSGKWQEFRVYESTGGKHIFSKVGRSVFEEEDDTHEAEIFDPSPSMPSRLLRSARDLAHTRPMQWTDAAADFFGYDPLAKALFRKLGGQFEERIS